MFQLVSVSTMLSHNSLFPKIKLFEEYFEYRILIKKKIFYTNIEHIAVENKSFMPKSVVITTKNGKRLWLTPGKEENFNELHRFFNEKTGLPNKQSRT